jgi:hypothetical protein
LVQEKLERRKATEAMTLLTTAGAYDQTHYAGKGEADFLPLKARAMVMEGNTAEAMMLLRPLFEQGDAGQAALVAEKLLRDGAYGLVVELAPLGQALAQKNRNKDLAGLFAEYLADANRRAK